MSQEPFWNPWAQKKQQRPERSNPEMSLSMYIQVFLLFCRVPNLFQPWTSTFWETFKSCIPSDRFRQKCQSYQSRQLGQHGCTCTWNSLRQAQTGAPTGEKVLTSSFFIDFFLKSANSCFAGCSLSFHLADSSKLCFSRPLASRNPPRNGPANKGLQNTPKQMLPKSISHDFGWITSITANHCSIAVRHLPNSWRSALNPLSSAFKLFILILLKCTWQATTSTAIGDRCNGLAL